MADLPPDTPDDRPPLEMPSFSLRRRKREAEDTAPEPEPGPAVPEPEPVAPEPVAPQPGPAPVVPEPEPTRAIPAPELHDETEAEDVGRRGGRPAPPVTGPPAALLVGLVVGLLAVAYAWLAGAGCDAVRGTTACGGAAGLPILVAGLVLLAWAGAVLLRFFGFSDAGSTSTLAVGLLAVLVMLFLLESLDEWWAAVAVPALAVLGYGLSWWVTASVVGDEAEVPEPHDVR